MSHLCSIDCETLPAVCVRQACEQGLANANGSHASIALLLFSVLLAGCGSLASPNSPDVVYDDNAEQARELQVPPDLTDVSDAEQFVLPGSSGAAVKRNTLLPQFSSVRFVRDGGQSWLEFEQTPENLWPQLLAFARKEQYQIDNTEPAAGTIVSQWRAASAVAKSNLLQNLIGGEEEFTRIAFRLERNGSTARLFARSQAASEEAVAAPDASQYSWPASSHDPENTSRLLARFLVFLGVEEQKARGILGQEDARAVLDKAVVQTNSSGSQLLLNHGFQSSFQRVVKALGSLQYTVVSTDDGVGRVEFTTQTEAAGQSLVLAMTPQHVSAVTLLLTDANGRRLDPDREMAVLRELLSQLS